MNEEMTKKQMGVQHWVHDVDFLESLELLVVAADREHRRPGRRIHGTRAAKPSCRIAPSRSSTCAWFRT